MSKFLIETALNKYKSRSVFDETYCNNDCINKLTANESEFVNNRKQLNVYENNFVFNKYCFMK